MNEAAETTTFLDMTRERWSVRRFAPDQISEEHMHRILEAGRNAPSVGNYQPQRVLALMPMGYPAQQARPSRWHFNRKSAEELYRFL